MIKLKSKKLKVESCEFLIVQISRSWQIKMPNPLIQFSTFAFLLFTFAIVFAPPIYAQPDKDEYPKDVVPPPLNFISKSEKKQLRAETKMKKRTKLALEFMDTRLTNSEIFLEKSEYQNSLNEVGSFRGLLKDILKFLQRNEHNKGSLKNFKKLEINLRGFLPRLEIIRREMPYKYGFHIKETMYFVRDSRTKALSPLFDDTVLSENN